jgi:hypothetical protein
MHEVMHSKLHIRRLKSLRRPSFAGNGLPERMRSTAFAFLGLTAALGLGLVAIFAQLSFSVLSPAPPPAGPAREGAVSSSLALGRGPGIAALQPALLGGSAPSGRAGSGASGTAAVPGGRGNGRVVHVGSPIPVEAPGKAGKPNDGDSVEPSPPPAAPAPTSPSGDEAASAETAPAPAPAPIPTSPDPKPVTSTPKPKPNEEPPAPAESEPKPGRHHGGKPEGGGSTPDEKPVKEPKPPKAEVPPTPTPAPPPAPEAPAEKGNGSKGKGKALGRYK